MMGKFIKGKEYPFLIAGLTILFSLFALGFDSFKRSGDNTAIDNLVSSSKLEQQILGVSSQPTVVYHLYVENQKIGTLHEYNRLQEMLDQLYLSKYVDIFPDSSLSFANEVVISQEITYSEYEDIDDLIVRYLEDNALIAFEAYKITFSNGQVAYLKNLEDFEEAKEQYVLNFIDANSYEQLKALKPVTSVSVNGEDVLYRSVNIVESATITKGYGPTDKILMDVTEVINYLSYGYNTEPDFYAVAEGDTVQGIARQHFLNPQHFLLINPEIRDEYQLLEVNSKVNVTFFSSPISVEVAREVTRTEEIDRGNIKYETDPMLAEGREEWIEYGANGLQDITFREVAVNGSLLENQVSVIDRVITKQPIQPIKRRGSRYIPGIGTGSFRLPLNNIIVSCGWFCYDGHSALDLQDRYDRYGPIFASDRGTVVQAGWNGHYGYSVIIDHGNGYRTLYAHMVRQPLVQVGYKVERGEQIGNVGNTGRSFGAHLHFEVIYNGSKINPSTVLGR